MQEKTIHLYYADSQAICPNYSLLDRAERDRCDRYLSYNKKEEFLKGRTFLKRVLACLLFTEPKAVSLAYTPNGKPFLPSIYGKPSLHFNLSHTQNEFALAVSAQPVGVDIETRASSRIEDFRLFLSIEEIQDLNAVEDTKARTALLYKLLTHKEAFIKATDKKWRLGDFHFRFQNGLWQLRSPEQKLFIFKSFQLSDETETTLCTPLADPEILIFNKLPPLQAE
ncbi:MAG: 4'-phosphopantetheinyl transferase superfamily protein [Cytophagales bacterium]|nr:4'-phosphopantetheinyl transferase superfamily protein [Cytophagales bacterium]